MTIARERRRTALAVAFAALVGTLVIVAAPPAAHAAPLVTEDLTGDLTPTDLAEALVGEGVTVSNVVYTGAAAASGAFSGGGDVVGFENGILLTTGSVATVIGPNTSTGAGVANGLPGDADLTSLAGQSTFDASILEFDFTADADMVFFEYVFASDEYNEYIDLINDVFAFFINAENCALVGGQPVSVNTVNNGNPFGSGGPNSGMFRNNDFQDGTAPIDTEMDGLTTVLTCAAEVTPGETNTMKLAIADASDSIFDSAVFIAAGSLSTTPPEAPNVDAGPDAAGTEGHGISVGESVDEGATLLWTYEAGDDVDAGATCEFIGGETILSPEFLCTDDGTYTVTVTATNEAGSSSDSAVVTVTNEAPGVFIDQPVGELLFETGETVAVSASFFDFGSNDTHTCSIDWGDGSIDAGTITNSDCTGAHPYADAGPYTITVIVADDDGGEGTAATDIEVEDGEEPPPPPGDGVEIPCEGSACSSFEDPSGAWTATCNGCAGAVIIRDPGDDVADIEVTGTNPFTLALTTAKGEGPKKWWRAEVVKVLADGSEEPLPRCSQVWFRNLLRGKWHKKVTDCVTIVPLLHRRVKYIVLFDSDPRFKFR